MGLFTAVAEHKQRVSMPVEGVLPLPSETSETVISSTFLGEEVLPAKLSRIYIHTEG